MSSPGVGPGVQTGTLCTYVVVPCCRVVEMLQAQTTKERERVLEKKKLFRAVRLC